MDEEIESPMQRLCDKVVPKTISSDIKQPKPQRSPYYRSWLDLTWRTRSLCSVFGLCISVIVFSWTPVVIGLRNRFGSFTVISAKPCQNALGQVGTCMFMWDCIKSEGIHLGTCSDRFLFGSCCYHNITSNDVDQQRTTPTSQNETRYTTWQRPQTNTTSSIYSSAQSNGHLHSTSILTNQAESELTQKLDPPPSTYNQSGLTITSENQSKINDTNLISWHKKPVLNGTSLEQASTSNWHTQLNSQGFPIHPHNPTQDQPSKQTTSASSTNYIVEELSTMVQPTTTTIAPDPQTSSPIISSTTALPIISDSNDRFQGGSIHGQTSSYPIFRPTQGTPSMQTQVPVTQRPQSSSSLLSRPASMLANAIFHSFKPFSYLHSNKQRPTYRPGFGGYRPINHQRPVVATSMNKPLNRPSFFGSRPHNQQLEQVQQQMNYQNDTKLPTIPNIPVSNSSAFIQDSSDHHVVNPSMIDRIRPIDRTQLYDQNNSHKQNHYEIFNSSSQSNEANVDKVDLTQAPIIQYETTNGIQSTNTYSTDTQLSDSPPKGNSTYIYHTSYEHGHNNSTESSNTNSVTLGNVLTSSSYDQHQPNKPVLSLEQSLLHHNDTSTIYPSSPYSHIVVGYQSAQGSSHSEFTQPSSIMTSSQSQTLSPIDEIHGLSVNTFDPSHGDSTNSSSSTQSTMQHYNQDSNQANTLASNQQMSTSILSEQEQNNANDLSTTQATTSTGSVTLLGNIDDHNSLITPEPTVIATFTSPSISATSPTIQSAAPTTTMTSTPTSTTTAFTMTTTAPVHSGNLQTSSATSQSHHNQYVAPGSTPPRVTTSNSYNSLDPNKKHGHGREATCGVTTLYPQTKVVGGKNAAFGAWPWQVSVRKTSLFGFTTTHRCGGAVISNEWIATAGHCVEDLPVQSIRLRVGEHDFSSTTEPFPAIERAARRKVVHPKYNVNTYENDLALVQLDRPLQFPPHVAPICLPPDDIDLLGKNATLTGWGRLNEGGLLPTILQEVRVPIVSNDECKDMFLRAGRQEYIPDIFLCAGYEEGGRDSCQGDSGGPLQVKGDDGKWFLAGIISWGIGCAEQNLPGVCTRISHFKLWIQSTIDSHS